MEKNIIQQRLELVEKLMNEVNSKEEFLWLQGMRDALQPLRYVLDIQSNPYQDHWLGLNKYSIQMKGGASKDGSDFLPNKVRKGLQDLYRQPVDLYEQRLPLESYQRRRKILQIPTYQSRLELELNNLSFPSFSLFSKQLKGGTYGR